MKYFLKKIIEIKSISTIFLFLFLTLPTVAHGATLFTTPSNVDVKVGDTFTISVNTNSQNAYINAATLDIKYDTSLLSVQGVGRSNSIFTLWTEEPAVSNSTGIVHFSGGLSSPGYNGSSGNIIKITFIAKATGEAKITLLNGSELANDGVGTNVLTSAQGTTVKIGQATQVTPKPKPAEKPKLEEDPEKPEEAKDTEEVFQIPVITDIPKVLFENDTLTFGGKGLPYGEIQVYIQKGNGPVEISQITTKEGGSFSINYRDPVTSGFYKVWAKSLSSDGFLGTSSQEYYVEVINKSSITLFDYEITYKNLSISLAGALSLVLLLLIIRMIFSKIKKVRNRE